MNIFVKHSNCIRIDSEEGCSWMSIFVDSRSDPFGTDEFSYAIYAETTGNCCMCWFQDPIHGSFK